MKKKIFLTFLSVVLGLVLARPLVAVAVESPPDFLTKWGSYESGDS
jgi:hypothetical protein